MTLDSGVGYSMFFEHMYQAIGSTCATKTVITWAAGCQTPFETCWKSRDTITVWCVIPRHVLSTGGKSGAAGTPVASDELAEEIRWFLTRKVTMALGIAASPAFGVILKVRIIETGEYKAICEEIRTIKETATSPMGGKAANGRERVYIIALAPACLMMDRNRKSLEEILTKRKGGGAGEKRTIKEIRDDMKKFGFELGDDHPNVMVACVGPGQAGDTRDDNVKKLKRSMSDEGESIFRRMMSTTGVIPGGTYDHTLCGRGTDSHMAVKKRYGREKTYGHEKGRM